MLGVAVRETSGAVAMSRHTCRPRMMGVLALGIATHYLLRPGMFSSLGAPNTLAMSSICSASVLPANSGRGSSSSALSV